MQGLVLQWGDEKFLVCLHSQWKDTRTYFMKTPPLLHIPFFEFCPTTPPPLPMSPPSPTPTVLSVALFL